MKKFIGIVGETGSGKNIFCKKINDSLDSVSIISSSSVLREALQVFMPGSKITKEDLQWMALVLFKRFGKNFLSQAVKRRMSESKKNIVVFDGMRMPADYKMIKEIGGKIIYITADPKTRWKRIQNRGEKKDDKSSYREFLRRERAATEISIPKIGKKADFMIRNNYSLEDFSIKIMEVLKKI
jgi:dephospho-CoA kinase